MNELNYKTVRYPGHHYLMDFLINGLRMGDSLETQRRIGPYLRPGHPHDTAGCRAGPVRRLGLASGSLLRKKPTRGKSITSRLAGEHWSAIQVTTAAAACVAVDLFRENKLTVKRGFVRQEDVELTMFLANRFGTYYS